MGQHYHLTLSNVLNEENFSIEITEELEGNYRIVLQNCSVIHPELTKTVNKTVSDSRLGPILDPSRFPELKSLLNLLVEDRSDLPDVADRPGLDPVADLDGRGGVQTILPASLELWRLRSVTEGRVHVGHDLVMWRVGILL